MLGVNQKLPRYYPPSAHKFREARFTAGIDVATCAKLLHVSQRTVRNWEAAQTRIPYAAYKLLRILKNGSVLGPEWRGYSVYRDTLSTPEGHTFKASELAWWSFVVRQAREFQAIMRARHCQALDTPPEADLALPLSMPRRPGAADGKDPSPASQATALGAQTEEPSGERGSGKKPLKMGLPVGSSPFLTLPERPESAAADPVLVPPPPGTSRSLRSRRKFAQEVQP